MFRLLSYPGVIFLFAVFSLFSCTSTKNIPAQVISDNEQLKEMVKKDQEMRNSNSNDPMEPVDQIHRRKVMELLANGLVRTFEDKLNAALILQHTALTFCGDQLKSISPENYYLAYLLSKSALDSGYKAARNFTATTYDRYLLYTEGYQKYGTQKIYDEKAGEWVWAPIDPLTTDQERQEYGIKPLAELLKESRMMPLKKQ
jgi:hypothetical protein